MEDIDCDRSNSYDFSESDCLTVTSSANQSHEMQNLVSTNEKLKYELEGYKRQYDEALSYMKQFEDLQGVVSELRKENSKLVDSIGEMFKVLSICLTEPSKFELGALDGWKKAATWMTSQADWDGINE